MEISTAAGLFIRDYVILISGRAALIEPCALGRACIADEIQRKNCQRVGHMDHI